MKHRLVNVSRILDLVRVREPKRKGNAWWSPCPLPQHPDRDPSWHITDDLDDERHGQWYCFGCSEGGGPIDLVKRVTGMSWAGARDWMEREGCFLDHAGSRLARALVVRLRAPCSTGFAMPREVTRGPVQAWPASMRRYLERRGVTEQQAERFGLGYAVDGRLAGRIVLPAIDGFGALLTYSARAIVDVEPKYQTPPRSDGPAIDRAILGEHLWGSERAACFVTEGGFNAMAVERALVPSTATRVAVAALMGSSLEPRQVLKLARFARVVIVGDPDRAGRRIARQLRAALSRAEVLVARLPEGRDANDLEPHELRRCIEEAR